MDMFDVEMARRYKARVAKHRVDQANHRAKSKAERRPERDDIERAALRVLLNSMIRHPDAAHGWVQAVARDLAATKSKFDPAKTTAVLNGIIERYAEEQRRSV